MSHLKSCLEKDRVYNYNQLFFSPSMSIPLQGQEPGWQSLGGSVFPSPEEAPSATSPGTEPTGTSEPLGTGTVSAELSSPWAAGDSERSECLGVCVCVRGEVGGGEPRAGICSPASP